MENKELKLKPGMTANVTITVTHKSDIIKIPNRALRFTPPGDIKADRKVKVDLKKKNSRLVWRIDEKGELEPVPIRTGITDGEYTELVRGDIRDGDELVIEAMDRNGDPIISKKTEHRQRSGVLRGFRP